jgi:hypothetical protein
MAGALGPIAACNVGDSQQGPPIVSGPAMQSYWRLGISVTQKRSIIGDPPSGLAKKHLKMLKSIKPQWRNGLNRSLTPQGDMDSSARQGRRQLADQCHRLRCPGGEVLRLVVVPEVRMTKALLRLWPLFRMPRSSSLPRRNVSASSMSNVGPHFATARKRAAAVTFDVGKGRGTTPPRNVRSVVLPHSGVGLVTPRTGDMSKQS